MNEVSRVTASKSMSRVDMVSKSMSHALTLHLLLAHVILAPFISASLM